MGRVARTPLMMQMEAAECGAASLGMILAYHNKWLTLEQIRKDCGVSRDGSSAKSIAQAAKGYGLHVKAYKMEPEAISAENIALPAIIHWQFNHFVVLCGFHKNNAVINDPARGSVTLSPKEFDAGFTGVILTFETTGSFVTGGRPFSVSQYAIKRLKGSGGAFAMLSVLTLAATAVGFLIPIFTQVYIDQIMTGRHMEWLSPFLAIFVCIAVFQLFIGVVSESLWYKSEGRFAIAGGAEFIWKILNLPVDFFNHRYVGDIVLRLKTNEKISSVFMRQYIPLIINMPLLIFYVAFMLQYSFILTAVSVSAVVLHALLSRFVIAKQAGIMQRRERDEAKLTSSTLIGIDMIETIKQAGGENGYFQKWVGAFVKSRNTEVELKSAEHVYMQLPLLVEQLTSIAVMTIGVYFILDGSYTVGTLMGFLGLLAAFLQPVRQIADAFQSILSMRANAERLEDVMAYPVPQVFEQNSVPTGQRLTTLSFDNITFGYNILAPPLLSDFSLTVNEGEVVAVVGNSGSGKSTLAKLAAGLYQPWSGGIFIGGRPLCEINRQDFAASVGMVEQEISLFGDSLRDNITMWKNDIQDTVMIKACKDANIYEDIVNRPGGFDFMVDAGGSNFSGGQKQRIEIARTLAREPGILILDEATSALDAYAEEQVMEAIRERELTCVIIAHRLSTIRNADRIVVLEKGRIIETGTHESLMLNNSGYAQLIAGE